MSGRRSHSLCALAVTALVALGHGCARRIGDGCRLDTDCSLNYDRRCDTTKQDGYCTIAACDPGSCPDDSVCVEFFSDSPRRARRFCMAACGMPSATATMADGCRGGYTCVAPTVTGTDPCPSVPTDPNVDQIPGVAPYCARLLDTVSVTKPRQNFCIQAPLTAPMM